MKKSNQEAAMAQRAALPMRMERDTYNRYNRSLSLAERTFAPKHPKDQERRDLASESGDKDRQTSSALVQLGQSPGMRLQNPIVDSGTTQQG